MSYELIYIANELIRVRKKAMHRGLIQSIEPVKEIAYPEVINPESINTLISFLREQDYQYFYIDEDDTRVLIKDNVDVNVEDLNPIHPYEAEMQFLRYLQGAYLIANNIEDKAVETDIQKSLAKVYSLFYKNIRKCKSTKEKCKLVLEETSRMADILAFHLYPAGFDHESKSNREHLSSAMKQLTMARDLCISLEKHPAVCTFAKLPDSNIITLEKGTFCKIDERYYQQENLFGDLNNQPWLYSAKDFAGLSSDNTNTWLDHFFRDHLHELAQTGTPATPSARWLPIPANVQHMEIITATMQSDSDLSYQSYNNFTRAGVIIPYDIRNIIDAKHPYDYQMDIALESLKAIIRIQLREQINRFKITYGIGDGEKFDFPVHYQTLLSPIAGEKAFHHADNNARFVDEVRLVAAKLDNDVDFKNEFADTGAQLTIYHTNTPINRHAPLTPKESKDKKAIEWHIESFRQFLQHFKLKHGANYDEFLKHNPVLANELTIRSRACDILEDMLNSPLKFISLKKYQFNLFIASLDHLLMGSQGLSIDGCKSSRDRTSVFASGVKAMLESSVCMQNWELLKSGVVTSLLQGQYFRSMNFHSGIVKVDLVHECFMDALNPAIQKDIKKLLVFSKDLNSSIHKISASRGKEKMKKREKLGDMPLSHSEIVSVELPDHSLKIKVSSSAVINFFKAAACVIGGALLGTALGCIPGFILAPFTLGLSLPIFAGIGLILGAIFLGRELMKPAFKQKKADVTKDVETLPVSRGSSYVDQLSPVLGTRKQRIRRSESTAELSDDYSSDNDKGKDEFRREPTLIHEVSRRSLIK